jgi:interferon-induced GTP-binding protein Mx1
MNIEILEEQAKPWLQLLDDLENLGIKEELPIPQIAVFGDQSSGKSSLLESISGIAELFPKGSGLVTRCPTKISMTKCSNDKSWSAEIRLPKVLVLEQDVSHIEGIVNNPKELAEKLKLAIDFVVKSADTGFSKDSIQVIIDSPTTPNLSIIDLPGIIRTTTAGQNKSVISDVDSLLNDFMSQPETIILAVIPCNQDIATIDILERANKFDPLGVRTIGVLTKPDLVDRG